MKFRTALVLLASAAMLLSAPAGAATGQQLLDSCESGVDVDQRACHLFLQAVWDSHIAMVMEDRNALFCPPESLTYDQIRRVALLRLKSVPGTLEESAALVTLKALQEMFPCAAREQTTAPRLRSLIPTPELGGVKLNAFGPGLHMDQFGRPARVVPQ